MDDSRASDFEKVAAEQSGNRFFVEFWTFLRHNKKWWLLPILTLLLLMGALLLLSSSAAAPFIYTLF
jgi:drug/metabolite transporter superfamily protein YnfA